MLKRKNNTTLLIIKEQVSCFQKIRYNRQKYNKKGELLIFKTQGYS